MLNILNLNFLIHSSVELQKLYQAGVKRWGTDENTFNMVLASQSHQQCKAVFEAYHKIAGHDIETAIKREMSGDLETGMVTIGMGFRNLLTGRGGGGVCWWERRGFGGKGRRLGWSGRIVLFILILKDHWNQVYFWHQNEYIDDFAHN